MNSEINLSRSYFDYVMSQAALSDKYKRIAKQLDKDILYGIIVNTDRNFFYVERAEMLPKYVREDIISWVRKQGYRYAYDLPTGKIGG